jgi:molecular chaperone DnaK (HSP70)
VPVRLGIDFGTTRIVVAAADRGNYPVISFEDAEGAGQDWFPPLIATKGDERLYGWEAWAAQADPTYTVIRSIKRTLEDAGPGTLVETGGTSPVPLLTILEQLVAALKTALREKSSLPGKAGEPLEVMLGVPANSHSNQRFLTVEPFQRAGFAVLGLLNEPSAASIEYGHRNRTAQASEHVLVYDLGGGTFDASLVDIEDRTHTVIASEGVPYLGGDDFDILLGGLALTEAGLTVDSLSQSELFRLHEECRARKEALNPNTRRIVVDLGAMREGCPEVTIAAAEYYERCRPLVEKTVAATEHLLATHDPGSRLEAVYITGGGSELPLVARALKESFGRKVRRSPYTRSATAIGLAIQADEQSGYVLREHFTRHFGVWREAEGGRLIIFDPLFEKGTALPGPLDPPVTLSRTYTPVHNIGHFRYLECSHRDPDGQPIGDLTVWDEIRFPFDPGLQGRTDLATIEVVHNDAAAGQRIEERYDCDAGGTVTVTILNLTSNYERSYRLGRWAGKDGRVVPGKRRRTARR